MAKANTKSTTPVVADYDKDRKDLKWGEHTVELGSLPIASVFALAQRGLAHILGNEVASAVSAAKKRAEEAHNKKYEGQENAPEYEEDPEAFQALLDEKRAEKWQAILSGTIGTASGMSRGPKRVGYEAHLHDVAMALIEGKAREKAMAEKVAVSAKMPKGEALKALLEQAKALPKVQAAARKKYEEEQALLEDDTTELDF